MIKKRYKVLVDDNFHFMDEKHRYGSGSFDTYDEAAAKCKSIIDDYLRSALEPGMTKEQLFASYTMFGEDPYITGGNEDTFEAWDYARNRCMVLVKMQRPGINKFIRDIDNE